MPRKAGDPIVVGLDVHLTPKEVGRYNALTPNQRRQFDSLVTTGMPNDRAFHEVATTARRQAQS